MSEFLADAQERSTILKVVHRRVMNRSVVLDENFRTMLERFRKGPKFFLDVCHAYTRSLFYLSVDSARCCCT